MRACGNTETAQAVTVSVRVWGNTETAQAPSVGQGYQSPCVRKATVPSPIPAWLTLLVRRVVSGNASFRCRRFTWQGEAMLQRQDVRLCVIRTSYILSICRDCAETPACRGDSASWANGRRRCQPPSPHTPARAWEQYNKLDQQRRPKM